MTALRDPLIGLDYEGVEPGPFDGATRDGAAMDYSPDQPRDKNGRWTGGGNGTMGKTKYAPSPRVNKRGKTVSTKALMSGTPDAAAKGDRPTGRSVRNLYNLCRR